MTDFFTKMAKTETKDRFCDLRVAGTFGKPYEFGEKIFGLGCYGEEEKEFLLNGYGIQEYGFSQYGANNIRFGVYQKRFSHWKIVGEKRKWYGKTFVIREKFFGEKKSQTEAQVICRNKFKTGMEAWRALTNEQRQEYNIKGHKIRLHGVNLFLKNWLKS